MTTDLSSASYVWIRHAATGDAKHSQALQTASACSALTPDHARRIWQLLETPQTVESLCRVLTSEWQLDRVPCEQHIRIVLMGWIEADLIELSPDT